MSKAKERKTQSKRTSTNRELLANMRPYAKGYLLPILIAALFAVVGSTISVIGPDKLKEITNLITNGIMTGIDLEQVKAIASGLAILYLIGAVMSYGQSFIVATVTQKFVQRLRTAIADKMNALPLSYFDGHSQGDTLSRVTNDLDTLGQSLNQSMSYLVSATVLLLGSLIMMFKTNWQMALTAILSVLVGFVGMAFIMSKSRIYFKAQQTNLANVNGYIEEIYSGHNVINSYNATNQACKHFDGLNEELYSSSWKSQFFGQMMMPLMSFIGNFGYVMVCVMGSILVLDNIITIGVIVAFMVYVRLFSQPLSQIAQAFNSLQSATASMDRVFEFLTEEEMEPEEGKISSLPTVNGEITFEDVTFGYEPDKTIIHHFSAQAHSGKKIAIVGPTGAGKTTIVNLLMKFYEVKQGRILLDEHDLNQLSRSAIHESFAMVLQDTWLFEGSIKENLMFNQAHVTMEDVEKACQAVGIDHFIHTLPHGYDTVLDEKVSLSVGQKQLLTIARALLKDAPLLILDEATSSVDTRTEELIQKAMDTLMEGRTSFVIAHRLSTIRNADLILVMKDGNIVEQGNHEALMEQKGFYADLYNSQFSEEAA